MDWTTLGNRLRARREQLGLSLRAAAAQAELSHGLLGGIELGQRDDTKIETMERFAKALGLELVVRVREPGESAVQDETMGVLAGLSVEQQKQVLRFARAVPNAKPLTVEGIVVGIEAITPSSKS